MAQAIATNERIKLGAAFAVCLASFALTNVPRFRQEVFVPVLDWAWMRDEEATSQKDSASESAPETQTHRNKTKATGEKIVKTARQWVGKEYKPGTKAMCAYFVRKVFSQVGIKPGITEHPADGHDPNPGTANSFFGTDMGTIVENPENLKAGDLVAYYNTYGDYRPQTITHVGIATGEGTIIDRPTASKPVREVPIDHFKKFAMGIRLNAIQEQTKFQRAIAAIFPLEGGYVDHELDKGGKTKYGVTAATAADHGIENVEEITKQEALNIYRQSYWPTCEGFDTPLDIACLNTAIHSGVGKAREFNEEVDRNGTPYEEAIAYLDRQKDLYEEIYNRDPSQKVFEKGWENRDEALRQAVRKYQEAAS